MMLTRRGLIGGFASLLAAPAIVRASSLMPVKAWSGGLIWIDTSYDEVLSRIITTKGGFQWAGWTPAPGWRLRSENGLAFHEPDTTLG